MAETQSEKPKNVAEIMPPAPEKAEKSPEQSLDEAKDYVDYKLVGEYNSELKVVQGQLRPKEKKAHLDKLSDLYGDSKYVDNNGEAMPQVLAEMNDEFGALDRAQKAGDKAAEKIAQNKLDDLYFKGVDWYHSNSRDVDEIPASLLPDNLRLRELAGGGLTASAENKAANLENFVKTNNPDALDSTTKVIDKLSVENIQQMNPEQRQTVAAEIGKAKKEMVGILKAIEDSAKEQMIPDKEANAFFADAKAKAAEIAGKIEPVRKMIVDAGYRYDEAQHRVVRTK